MVLRLMGTVKVNQNNELKDVQTELVDNVD